MISRTLEERERARAQRVHERFRGVPASLLRFTSAREAETQIAVVQRLPSTLRTTGPMQDSDGNFYFDTGYSFTGGPDIT